MRKTILTILLILGLCSVAFAEPIKLGGLIDKLPALTQGVCYNVVDSQFEYISTTTMLNKGNFALEIGYASEESLIVVASYKLLSLKDYIDTPIVKELMARPGIFMGIDRLNRGDGETVWGVSFTMMEIKF